MIEFQSVAAAALARAEVLVPLWLPNGKKHGREWVCGDLDGAPGTSLSVNMHTGQWADFSTEAKGGDLISLYAAIHHVSQLDAAKALADEPAAPLANGHHDEPVQMHRPPNVDFQPSLFKHYKMGTPVAFWVYRDKDGPICAVARYEPQGERKQIVPWIWTGLKWHAKAPDKPRSLYGLDRLTSLTGPVLLVEGEKTADAAQRYWPKRPCLTWMGGVAGSAHADWEPLRGREVTVWPDADDPGRECMAKVAAMLLKIDCKVRVVDPKDYADGWDLADAEASGLTGAYLVNYAKANTKEISPPATEPPKALKRITEMPAHGTQTYEQAPPRGSLVELYQREFQVDHKGKPHMNQLNVVNAIRVRGDMQIYYDSFSQRIMAGEREWSDEMQARFTTFLQKEYEFSNIKPHIVEDGVKSYAFEHRRNPPQEWLNGLTWDQQPRLRDLMKTGMGASPGAYSASVGRCFMVGMVARVMEPGCKVDQMPVLEGKQGARKSTALKIIGGQYFSEIHESITTKDFLISITGKMLCEISELSAFTRNEISRIKGVISNASDRYRSPYGKHAVDHARTCVFAGTTNADDWNTDETGARRFWPIRCGEINTGWLADNREQLFAEAMWRYNAGEQWWDVPEEEAKIQQAARLEVDPWEYLVQSYCEERNDASISWVLNEILKVDPAHQTMVAQKRVGKIFRKFGFEIKSTRVNGNPVSKWQKKRTDPYL